MGPQRKTVLIALAPAFVAGLAATIVASLLRSLALEVPLQFVVVAAVVVMTWRAAAAIEHATAESTIEAVAPAVLQRMAADRRRPTFDRETGLLADWYFRLRVEEEIARAQRYGQKFTMLRIADVGDEAHGGIALAARTCLRAIDLAGSIGSSTCVLLPNTPRDAAHVVVGRLLALAPQAQIDAAECPTDASTLAGLLGETEWTTHEASPDEAAA